MASLLASLHYVLVILAIAAAALSLMLESSVTSKLYEFFYKETAEARERGYIGDLLVQPKTTKEIRAYVLADYLLERYGRLSENLFRQRTLIYRSGTRVSLFSGFVTGTTLALAYLFVSLKGSQGLIDPGGVVLVIGAFTSVSSTLAQITGTFVSVDQHTTFSMIISPFYRLMTWSKKLKNLMRCLLPLMVELSLIVSALRIPEALKKLLLNSTLRSTKVN